VPAPIERPSPQSGEDVARAQSAHAASGPPEVLARALARSLRSPAMRARLNAQLDGSRYREHKIHFQRFLHGDGERELHALAAGTATLPADVAHAADAAIPLELYLPVPAHRASWTGDGRVLVATAIGDHDAPIVFDTGGVRYVLDARTPPATPVLALVPTETNFAIAPSLMQCDQSCHGGGNGDPPPPIAPTPGLYMTQAHFTQSFESWLKGAPEFEVHILGQKGQTDSLADYQCIGEKQAQPYYFDQNDPDWSGSVMLFSQAQMDSYKTTHPNQNVRVYVVEDDDTACEIKTSPSDFQRAVTAVDDLNRALTAGRDSAKTWTFAHAIQKVFSAFASVINTNDELVGNAVRDSIAGEFHTGFNWIVKGQDNVTNGWIKLEMR
jgi:hypothetical protein